MFVAFSPEDSRRLIGQERLKAPRLAETLRALPHEDAKRIAYSSTGFRTWGLCEYFIDRSWAARFDNARETLECAELALCVVTNLAEDVYGEKHLADLHGRTWTNLGNAHRIASHYQRRKEGFETASIELAQGTNSHTLKAELAFLHSILATEQARHHDALALINEAIALYQLAGDEHAVAISRAQLATVYGFSGDPERAISVLDETIPELNPQTNPTAFYAATQTLAFFYEQVGEADKALDVLRTVVPYYRRTGDTLNIARINWTEGKISLRKGNIPFAEALFLNARKTFIEQGIGFDAAQVSLYLADIYLSAGRVEALHHLAVEIVPIFNCGDMHTHATAALLYFQTAIQTLTIDHLLVGQLLAYLEKARFDPELEFLAT